MIEHAGSQDGDKGQLQNKCPPTDEGGVAYMICFLLGAGFLFPWNAFVTAVDYFDALYPHRHIDRAFTTAYMVPNLVSLLLLVLFARQTTSRARTVCGFWAMLLVVGVVPVLDAVLGGGAGRGTPASLAITVGAVAAAGAIDACLQSSLYGAAAELPERYTQALVGGTAASGVIVNCLRIVTKAAMPHSQAGLRLSADLYFVVSAIFIAGCVVGFDVFERLPVIRYYRSMRAAGDSEASRSVSPPKSGNASGRSDKSRSFQAADVSGELAEQEEEPLQEPFAEGVGDGSKRVLLEPLFSSEANLIVGHAMSLARENTDVAYTDVVWDIWLFGASLTLVYVVTLSIFPGFLSEDVHSAMLQDWYPLVLMTAYNAADLAGKTVPGLYAFPRTPLFLVGGAVIRLGFYPLFALSVWGPPWLRTELPVIALTAALGFTNGYVTTILMMVTPKLVAPERSEAAGVLMVLFLVVGLFIGSFAGWLWLL